MYKTHSVEEAVGQHVEHGKTEAQELEKGRRRRRGKRVWEPSKPHVFSNFWGQLGDLHTERGNALKVYHWEHPGKDQRCGSMVASRRPGVNKT